MCSCTPMVSHRLITSTSLINLQTMLRMLEFPKKIKEIFRIHDRPSEPVTESTFNNWPTDFKIAFETGKITILQIEIMVNIYPCKCCFLSAYCKSASKYHILLKIPFCAPLSTYPSSHKFYCGSPQQILTAGQWLSVIAANIGILYKQGFLVGTHAI